MRRRLTICWPVLSDYSIRVVDIEFEFQGPADVLAECAGPQPTDDEKFTASDVAIRVVDDNGRAGLVLVEVKLSEGGFTPCNGARSAANRRKDVCASAATFFDDPHACYLRRTRHAQRDRRYWDIFDAEFGSVRAAVPGFPGERCPFEGDHQQLMRNHALALGLIQAGEAAFHGLRARSPPGQPPRGRTLGALPISRCRPIAAIPHPRQRTHRRRG